MSLEPWLEWLVNIVTAIFFLWSVVLLWFSWRLWHFVQEERQRVECWKRLRRVAESQQSRWQ
jgi:predicted membrane channel-forming protein YqfA (hemolysin III family)